MNRARRRPIRWWPAIGILILAAGLLIWSWTRQADSTQDRVLSSVPTLLLGGFLLVVWATLFSRLAGKVRLGVLLGVVGLGGLGVALFEVQGVDGDLVPIVGLRWAGERTFGETVPGSESTTELPGSGDYAQFYGPGRAASLSGPALARDWGANPPRELWRRDVGEGHSAFALAGNAAITQEQRGEHETVVRYELQTGRQIWVHSDTTAYVNTVGGNGPRATPTIDAGRVYTLGSTGLLNCLDLERGTPYWTRNVLTDHDARQPDWGMTSSPLVVGDAVIVHLGQHGRGSAAYHRLTGEPLWRAGEDPATYSTPILGTLAGREQVLSLYLDSVTGHDPLTGEVLWRHDWPNPGGQRATMPLVVGDDRVLVSAGYGMGSRLLQVKPTASGFDVELLWESRRLKSKFAPMVLHDGVVYGLDDGVLVALDLESGERLWKRGRYGHGQFILVDDLLLIQAEDGELVLVEANAEGHRELASMPALSRKTWNPLALSGRIVLVRNDREAIAYEIALATETSSVTR